MAPTDAGRGAENLLFDCAGMRAGERLLLATEPPELGFFDAEVAAHVADAARRHGIAVDSVDVGFEPRAPHLSADLRRRMASADVVIFLARLGDQLRFSDMPADARIVVCFAHRAALIGSAFGTAPYAAFTQVRAAVDARLAAAREVRITCPAGTDVSGRPRIDLSVNGDTTVKRFPMSVFTPVPAGAFSGRVALRFLTGTGSRYYDGEFLEFGGPVHAVLRAGRLAGFEGAADDVARAEAQYDRVARLFDLDRDAVHSWHAGIHPGCAFPWDVREVPRRWGGAAFGNPRILHFHTCGARPPGEICWNVFDPTIEADGVALWERGVLRADRLAQGRAILDRHPEAAALFAAPATEIGVALPWAAAGGIDASREGRHGRDTAPAGRRYCQRRPKA